MTNEQAIIELRDLISDNRTDNENEALLLAIEKLREARPQGEWIEVPVKRDILHPNGIKYVCTACKRDNCYGKPPFCMWCGADMREGGAE